MIKKDIVIRLKQVEHTANEKNILSCIDCPFVIKLVDYFQVGGGVFLPSPFLPLSPIWAISSLFLFTRILHAHSPMRLFAQANRFIPQANRFIPFLPFPPGLGDFSVIVSRAF